MQSDCELHKLILKMSKVTEACEVQWWKVITFYPIFALKESSQT